MTFCCQNCDHKETNPPFVKDLSQRISNGDVYTDRECSVCGALTHIIKPEPDTK